MTTDLLASCALSMGTGSSSPRFTAEANR